MHKYEVCESGPAEARETRQQFEKKDEKRWEVRHSSGYPETCVHHEIISNCAYTRRDSKSGNLQVRDSRIRCLCDGQAEVASRLRRPLGTCSRHVAARYPRDDGLQGDIPRRYSIRPHRP